VRELAAAGLIVLADKGYTRAGRHVHKGRYKPASQEAANLAHAKLRTHGERANANPRSGTSGANSAAAPDAAPVAKAVHVLQDREIAR
jgi:hypothetical protein